MEKFANFEDQTGTAVKVETVNQKSLVSTEKKVRVALEHTEQMVNEQSMQGIIQGKRTVELPKASLPEAVTLKNSDKKTIVANHSFSKPAEDREQQQPHRPSRDPPRRLVEEAEKSPKVNATDSLIPIDEIDFELRAGIEGGCSQCRAGTCFK